MLLNDEFLLNTSIIITLIGLSTLAILSYFQKIPSYDLNEITYDKLGEKISIEGKIVSINNYNNQTTIKLENTCFLEVKISERTSITQNISHEYVKIKGIVEEYNDKIYLRAEEILPAKNTPIIKPEK
jgi:hypothetical protein